MVDHGFITGGGKRERRPPIKKSVWALAVVILLFAAGCANEGKEEVPGLLLRGDVEMYMASVREQADAIKTFLERDAQTQSDMNTKSQELYQLWEEALNCLLGELKQKLPEKEFEELQGKQRAWLAEKEAALKETGKEVAAGSIYSLVVNSEAARLTEERVYELYKLLQE